MTDINGITKIPFNKPFISGKEYEFISDAVSNGHLSGNGKYTRLCHAFFEERYNVNKVLLTTSCTDALEMAAMLIDIQPGDEVIVPSYTFVSSALAFTRMGAKIVFIDSMPSHPNMNVDLLEGLITSKTKAIIPVHYGGVACEMDTIMSIANKHRIFVIEDAAQAIESKYKGKQLGTIGHFGAFSFHETKNIQCGEGGLLLIRDEKYNVRAETIWEKGTNRASFFRGEINKYGWVDTGSSFLPSDILAAFLYAQLLEIETIQALRRRKYEMYMQLLQYSTAKIKLPVDLEWGTNNAHVFYLTCSTLELRSQLIELLKSNKIFPVFHYLSLHKSDFIGKYDAELPNSDMFSDCLIRLPLFAELSEEGITKISSIISNFLSK